MDTVRLEMLIVTNISKHFYNLNYLKQPWDFGLVRFY